MRRALRLELARVLASNRALTTRPLIRGHCAEPAVQEEPRQLRNFCAIALLLQQSACLIAVPA